MIDLRKEISMLVHRAIDSSNNYSGEEKEQNQHNWEQITTDRILASIVDSLPEPINIGAKYETNDGGIFLDISTEHTADHNKKQLDYLAEYQTDVGFNTYFGEYTDYLRGLYTPDMGMVQSEHGRTEDITIHGSDPSEDDSNSQPSKVR